MKWAPLLCNCEVEWVEGEEVAEECMGRRGELWEGGGATVEEGPFGVRDSAPSCCSASCAPLVTAEGATADGTGATTIALAGTSEDESAAAVLATGAGAGAAWWTMGSLSLPPRRVS